jgi:hypothetical protein
LAKKVAKKAKTAETYPRTRPVPARSAVIPPRRYQLRLVKKIGLEKRG